MRGSPAETGLRATPDAEINRLWLAGDPLALDRAHRRYRRRLEAVAFRIVRSREDAEDVVQRIFVALPGVAARGTASLWTYLYRAAVNGALSVLRTRARRRHLERTHLRPLGGPQVQRAELTEERVLEGQVLSRVAQALSEVKPRYREVLTLRIVHNLSNTEIAEQRGVPLATVNTRLRRGREELRRKLGPLLRELGREDP